MARRKNSLKGVEQVDYYEEVSDGFFEGDVSFGKVITSFSFAPEPAINEATDSSKSLESSPVSDAESKEPQNEQTDTKINSQQGADQTEEAAAPKAIELNFQQPAAEKKEPAAPTGFQFNFQQPAAPKRESAAPMTFKFNTQKPASQKKEPSSAEALIDTRKTKTAVNVSTPPVDGEPYTVGRYYKLRYSTAKMLNEIKADHEDVNVYMNSIVDEAIRWYHGFLFGDTKV